MRGLRAIAFGLACACASAAPAAELVLGVDAETRYDTNVFRREADTDDYSGKLGPTLRLRERQGPAKYDFLLRSQYQQYWDIHNVSATDYYGRGSLDWDLSERTTFSFDETFYHTPSLIQQTIASEATGDPNLGPSLVQGHEYYTINDASASVSHLLSRRLRWTSSASSNVYEPHGSGRTSSLTFSGDSGLAFSLDPKNVLGGGLGFTDQGFSPEGGTTAHTRFYQLFGTYTHLFDQTFTFTMQAGPTMVDNDTPEFGTTSDSVTLTPHSTSGGSTSVIDLSSCPTTDGVAIFTNECGFGATSVEQLAFDDLIARGASFTDAVTGAAEIAQQVQTGVGTLPIGAPPKAKSSSLTYFASTSLEKRWRNLVGTLGYRRSASSSSGLAVSSVLDTVSGGVTWQPSPLWYLSFSARFDRRTASGDQVTQLIVLDDQRLFTTSVLPAATLANVGSGSSIRLQKINSDQKIDGFTFFATANRRFSRRLVGIARLTYFTQKQKFTGFRGTKYDQWVASLGMQWEFDPIQIPFL